jgi:hypothetical protein
MGRLGAAAAVFCRLLFVAQYRENQQQKDAIR